MQVEKYRSTQFGNFSIDEVSLEPMDEISARTRLIGEMINFRVGVDNNVMQIMAGAKWLIFQLTYLLEIET